MRARFKTNPNITTIKVKLPGVRLSEVTTVGDQPEKHRGDKGTWRQGAHLPPPRKPDLTQWTLATGSGTLLEMQRPTPQPHLGVGPAGGSPPCPGEQVRQARCDRASQLRQTLYLELATQALPEVLVPQ